MPGLAYGETYRPKCPYCNYECYSAEYVDVGVGMQQVSPHRCDQCGAIEMGAYDKDLDSASKEEKKKGWYAPDPKLAAAVLPQPI